MLALPLVNISSSVLVGTFSLFLLLMWRYSFKSMCASLYTGVYIYVYLQLRIQIRELSFTQESRGKEAFHFNCCSTSQAPWEASHKAGCKTFRWAVARGWRREYRVHQPGTGDTLVTVEQIRKSVWKGASYWCEVQHSQDIFPGVECGETWRKTPLDWSPPDVLMTSGVAVLRCSDY